MAISNQVSISGATHLNAAPRKDKPEVKWLGRTVHEAISGASVDRLFAIIGVIVFLAGLIFIPFDLALAITLAPLGGFCAYLGFSGLYKGNPLEKALVHLIGSKEKLERLPEVKRTKIDIHPKDGNVVNYLVKKEVLGIVPEAMTANRMRVTENGKTIGVAFKYMTVLPSDSPGPDEKTQIRVYFFQAPKEFKLVKVQDTEGSYKSKDKMTAAKGKALEAMIKNNCFVQR